jgi:hypothetical protein
MCRGLKRLGRSCTRCWRCEQTGGGSAREDDAEAELLGEDDMFLGDGEVVAMAVKELPPFVWRTFAEATTAISGGTAKGHAPHCPPKTKTAVSTPLHAPLSTRLDGISLAAPSCAKRTDFWPIWPSW